MHTELRVLIVDPTDDQNLFFFPVSKNTRVSFWSICPTRCIISPANSHLLQIGVGVQNKIYLVRSICTQVCTIDMYHIVPIIYLVYIYMYCCYYMHGTTYLASFSLAKLSLCRMTRRSLLRQKSTRALTSSWYFLLATALFLPFSFSISLRTRRFSAFGGGGHGAGGGDTRCVCSKGREKGGIRRKSSAAKQERIQYCTASS